MNIGLSTHTARNHPAINGVLQIEFARVAEVLEIGSGDAQHATLFAATMPHLQWQTSDLEQNHATIIERIRCASLSNVLAPIALDVRTAAPNGAKYDAVFSANTAHIMGIAAVKQMFSVVSASLRSNGLFCLYGPFRQGGKFNTDSNAQFHATLRARDAEMGIRDLEELNEFADSVKMRRQRLYAMPSNNLLVVWQRSIRAE